MDLKNSIHFFLITCCVLAACASGKKGNKKACLSFESLSLCFDGKKEILNGIDGELGKIVNPNYILNYEIAKAAYKGPEDDTDYFRKVFNNYHHMAFFESLKLDKKVYKIYRDSVLILKISDIATGSDKTCKSCNKSALLRFKGKEIPFPYQVTDQLMESISKGSTKRYIKSNLFIKIYDNDKESGVVIEKTSQNRNAKLMSIQLLEGDKKKFIEDLKIKLQLN